MEDKAAGHRRRNRVALSSLACTLAVVLLAGLVIVGSALAGSTGGGEGAGGPLSAGVNEGLAAFDAPAGVTPTETINQYLGAAGPSGAGAPWSMISLGNFTANGPGINLSLIHI